MVDQIKISKSSPEKKGSTKSQDPTTDILSKRNASSLEGGNSTKNGGMWILKHEIK